MATAQEWAAEAKAYIQDHPNDRIGRKILVTEAKVLIFVGRTQVKVRALKAQLKK